MKKFVKLDLAESKLDITLGYMYIYSPYHPMANKSGKVYTHRYIMAEKLGRYLTSDEVVHHDNHNKSDNSLSNLILLSNCSEHNKIHNEEKFETLIDFPCKTCGILVKKYQERYQNTFCSDMCSSQAQKKFDPTPEELHKLVWEMPTTKVAKMFNVSDKAIHKRCKRFNITKPPRGYWSK